jgi:hypothetical protein
VNKYRLYRLIALTAHFEHDFSAFSSGDMQGDISSGSRDISPETSLVI